MTVAILIGLIAGLLVGLGWVFGAGIMRERAAQAERRAEAWGQANIAVAGELERVSRELFEERVAHIGTQARCATYIMKAIRLKRELEGAAGPAEGGRPEDVARIKTQPADAGEDAEAVAERMARQAGMEATA